MFPWPGGATPACKRAYMLTCWTDMRLPATNTVAVTPESRLKNKTKKKQTLLFTSLLMLSLKPQEACSTSLPSSAASVQFNGILKGDSEVGLINNFWSAVTYGVKTTHCYTFSLRQACCIASQPPCLTTATVSRAADKLALQETTKPGS